MFLTNLQSPSLRISSKKQNTRHHHIYLGRLGSADGSNSFLILCLSLNTEKQRLRPFSHFWDKQKKGEMSAVNSLRPVTHFYCFRLKWTDTRSSILLYMLYFYDFHTQRTWGTFWLERSVFVTESIQFFTLSHMRMDVNEQMESGLDDIGQCPT